MQYILYGRQQDVGRELLAGSRPAVSVELNPRGGIYVMMMTNERKIWEAALLLVRRHGSDAVSIAEREAERLKGGDDELTCVVWCWIARSTAELLRPIPDAGERVH